MTLIDDIRDLISRNRAAAIWSGALAVVFLLSLILYLVLDTSKFGVVIYFPNDSDHRLTGEQRFVPRSRSIEENMTTVVNNVILGPEQLMHDRALAKETSIRALMVKGSTAFVDLSPDLLFPTEDVALTFDESIRALQKTILFNFPGIKRVVVTVNGEEPSSEVSANN